MTCRSSNMLNYCTSKSYMTTTLCHLFRIIMIGCFIKVILLPMTMGLTQRNRRNRSGNDPFHTSQLMTSRAVITIKGRDPSRQLTTYSSEAGGRETALEFGFPPAASRHYANERMEIFDASTSLDQSRGIRKITLRHPWHDVYITADDYHNVRACRYVTRQTPRRRNMVCRTPPYIYLEAWQNVTSSGGSARSLSTNQNCSFKMRFQVKRQRNSRQTQIAYAHVSDATWAIRLRTQASLLTHALSVATKRAWEESLNVLFLEQINRFQKRRKRDDHRARHRRCITNPITIRNELMDNLTVEELKNDIKHSLKRKRECVNEESVYQNNFLLAAKQPWRVMTFDAKASLMCHVGYVVRRRLRNAFMNLAYTSCIKRRTWGRLSEKKRRRLLNHYLTDAWQRRKSEADRWLIGIVDSILDFRMTSFCVNDLT